MLEVSIDNFKEFMFNKTILFFLITSILGCSANQATKGSLAGGALGAGLGAIIGNQAGHHAGAGLAIGTAAGAIAGGLIGNSLDQQDNANQQAYGQLNRNQQQIDENRRLIEELKGRGADVRSSNRGVVVNLPDILFEFNKARLTPEARRTVAEISDVLRTVQGRTLAVEGHTDSVGTVVYNKDLSIKRARSVAEELNINGISNGQMRVTGFGEGSPIATNNTDEGRARNRRVEVIVENR